MQIGIGVCPRHAALQFLQPAAPKFLQPAAPKFTIFLQPSALQIGAAESARLLAKFVLHLWCKSALRAACQLSPVRGWARLPSLRARMPFAPAPDYGPCGPEYCSENGFGAKDWLGRRVLEAPSRVYEPERPVLVPSGLNVSRTPVLTFLHCAILFSVSVKTFKNM